MQFKSWLEGEGAALELDKALDVFELEQFVNCLPVGVASFGD